MKNQNVFTIPNKLVFTTKKFVLLFFAILNVTSSNADSFSEHPIADSPSLPLNLPIQGQPTISNAESLIQMKEDDLEEDNSKKNEALEKIQTSLTPDEEHTTSILPEFKSYVLTLIDKELNLESTKKIHSFLKVYKNIITNVSNNFYFKIIDENKSIIACFGCDFKSYGEIEVDLRRFMKRATEHYPTHIKNEENYYEENAVAAFCDKDSGEMIIKFLDPICKTEYNWCLDESGLIAHCETGIILEKSGKIIKLIRESFETLNSQKQKIPYPICYIIWSVNDGDRDEPLFVIVTGLYTES